MSQLAHPTRAYKWKSAHCPPPWGAIAGAQGEAGGALSGEKKARGPVVALAGRPLSPSSASLQAPCVCAHMHHCELCASACVSIGCARSEPAKGREGKGGVVILVCARTARAGRWQARAGKRVAAVCSMGSAAASRVRAHCASERASRSVGRLPSLSAGSK